MKERLLGFYEIFHKYRGFWDIDFLSLYSIYLKIWSLEKRLPRFLGTGWKESNRGKENKREKIDKRKEKKVTENKNPQEKENRQEKRERRK